RHRAERDHGRPEQLVLDSVGLDGDVGHWLPSSPALSSRPIALRTEPAPGIGALFVGWPRPVLIEIKRTADCLPRRGGWQSSSLRGATRLRSVPELRRV